MCASRQIRISATAMAARELITSKRLGASASSLVCPLILSIFCLLTVMLCFSIFRSDTVSPTATYSIVSEDEKRFCNLSDGKWILNSSIRSLSRYDHTCKEIFKGWNCIAGKKANAIDILKWRWKPYGCELPPFDPLRFLEDFRDTSIGFVGDSLNRNMFVSLLCALKQVSNEVKKWRPVGADRGFTFLKYNLTIAYHRTNLLAHYGRWSASSTVGSLESLGYKEGYRIDTDVPDGTWIQAPNFHDILIINSGHWWWAPSKFDPLKSPMLFFEKGTPMIPPIAPDEGFSVTLEHMISFVENNARPGAILFFRTQSPRHFEGGDWNQGGSCPRIQPLAPQEVEDFFSLKNNGTNAETRLVNYHLYRAVKDTNFHVLDITRMSEFRADAHPSSAGGKKHDDCMHWCLPGLTDTWNDLFVAYLNRIRAQK